MPKSRSPLVIIFITIFIDLVGFGIVIPVLPLYAERYGASETTIGILLAIYSAMQFIFAPMWGRVSDRIGRRPVLLLGLCGSVVFYTLFGIASEIGEAGRLTTGLILLFVARLGAGMAGATISTAQAVIADVTTSEGRSRGMAMIGAAFGIGFTFGPLLGFASLFVPMAGAPGFAAARIGFALRSAERRSGSGPPASIQREGFEGMSPRVRPTSAALRRGQALRRGTRPRSGAGVPASVRTFLRSAAPS